MQIEAHDQATPGGRKRATSLRPFGRLLGYVFVQKRYLLPALGCIVLMAITYSISLGSVLPVLTVLIQPRGLHGWIDQYVSEKRLDCSFTVYDPTLDSTTTGIEPGTLQVFDLKDTSPLKKTGIRRGMFIVRVNEARGHAVNVLPVLAASPVLEIECRDSSGKMATFRPSADPLPVHHRALRRAVAWIPGGISADDRWRTLKVVLVLLAGVTIIGNVAGFGAEYLTVIVNCRAIMDLRRKMYAQALKLPLSHFSRNANDTMSRFIQDSNEIFRGLSNFFEKIVQEPFKAVGATVVALWVKPKVTLVVLVAAPLAVFVIRILGKKIRRANRKLLMTYSQMIGALESTLTGMRVVKAYRGEHYERRRLFRIDRRVLASQLKMGRTEAMASPFLELLAFAGVVCAILYFAHQILHGGALEEMSRFLATIVALAAIFDPIRKLSAVYPKIQRASAAAERVFELIDRPNEYTGDAARPRLKPLQHEIKFEHVGYTYPESNRPALRDVSLTVKKGEIVALVGPNGCGKTTLVSLLPRFFSIESGKITIDGQDINEVSLRSLREQFSLITQESVIFPDTVRSNIAYGLRNVPDADVQAAATKAFADEFIGQMPNGYDTIVGEHGATLSGGQKQRIAIARAILRNSPILIFDEATAQVDPESEMKIHQALDSFLEGRTAFIIAHRYSTVRNADRIVVMDDGNIAAVGTHDELLQTCPLYGRLYEAQFRSAGATAEEAVQAVAMTAAQKTLVKMYEAFNARDIETVLSSMHPDVDWPNGWEGGRLHGRDNVRDYWTRQWQSVDPHVEPQTFKNDQDGRIIVDVHQIVKDLDGKVLSDGVVKHVYRLQDGLVVSMDIRG